MIKTTNTRYFFFQQKAFHKESSHQNYRVNIMIFIIQQYRRAKNPKIDASQIDGLLKELETICEKIVRCRRLTLNG